MLLKRIIAAIIFTVVFFAFIYLEFEKNKEFTAKIRDVTEEFNAEILDIGKADAIILRSKKHTIIIDCGEKDDAQDILLFLSENDISYVDYLFITHFDKDHIGGASEIINNLDIGNVITPNYEGKSKEYENYIKSCYKKGISPVCLKDKMSFILDDVYYEVYPPLKGNYDESDNDFSLAICVTHGKNTFLFAGDAEAEREKEFKNQFELKHTFLKVPHHGRYNDETEGFLKSVAPAYAVITCSKNAPPDDSVLNLLKSIGCKTFLTSDGNVNIKSDGKNLVLTQ